MWRIHAVTKRPLAEFVEFLWTAVDYAPAHVGEWILPTGTVDIVINLNSSEAEPGWISGVQASAVYLETRRPLSLIGARLRPGGARAILGHPAGELCNASARLEEIWGGDAVDLRDGLLRTTGEHHQVAMFEHFLHGRLLAQDSDNAGTRFAMRQHRNMLRATTVHELADLSGLSAWRYSSLFLDHIGLTPKRYLRLIRFRRAIATIQDAAEVDWVTVAMDCGYFDHAHFCHDFRAFSGVTPADYLRRRTAHPNHVRPAAK